MEIELVMGELERQARTHARTHSCTHACTHARSVEQRSACQDLFRKILPEDSDVSNKTLKHELAKVGVPITVRGCTHVCSCVHARTRVSTEPEKVGTATSVRSLWLADSHTAVSAAGGD